MRIWIGIIGEHIPYHIYSLTHGEHIVSGHRWIIDIHHRNGQGAIHGGAVAIADRIANHRNGSRIGANWCKGVGSIGSNGNRPFPWNRNQLSYIVGHTIHGKLGNGQCISIGIRVIGQYGSCGGSSLVGRYRLIHHHHGVIDRGNRNSQIPDIRTSIGIRCGVGNNWHGAIVIGQWGKGVGSSARDLDRPHIRDGCRLSCGKGT